MRWLRDNAACLLVVGVLLVALFILGSVAVGGQSELRAARDSVARLSNKVALLTAIQNGLSNRLEEAEGELRATRNSLETAQAIGRSLDEVFRSGDDAFERFRESFGLVEGLLEVLGVLGASDPE